MRWVPPGNHVQHPAGTNQQLTFATEHATELEEPATVLEEKHLHKNQLFSPEYRSFVCIFCCHVTVPTQKRAVICKKN